MRYEDVLERMGIAPPNWCTVKHNEFQYLKVSDVLNHILFRHYYGYSQETYISDDLYWIYRYHILKCDICKSLLDQATVDFFDL